jgi:pimeloyl-ACP methyl ester carboxylesterase
VLLRVSRKNLHLISLSSKSLSVKASLMKNTTMRQKMVTSICVSVYQVKSHPQFQIFIGPKDSNAKENIKDGGPRKPVVILQHGLLSSSTDWFLNGDNSLPFLLADSGYDVWVNNTRGNRHSRNHVFLDPDNDKEFWDYSFEDMAKYDQPALFNYVLDKTGVRSVSYVGHSQGTTQMFAALSENFDFFK